MTLLNVGYWSYVIDAVNIIEPASTDLLATMYANINFLSECGGKYTW